MYMGGIGQYVHGYWPRQSGKSQSVNQSNSLTNIHFKSGGWPKPFEYPDFVAFIQCGVSRRSDEMDSSSSDSGTDTKEKEQDDYLSTSFDSNSEVEFGDI